MNKQEINLNIESAENIVKGFQLQQQRWTNNVLIKKNLDSQNYNFYIPCYLRVKLKNIVSINITDMIGQVNLKMIISVFYGQLKGYFPQIVQQLQKNIVLGFRIDPSLKLQEGLHKYKDRQGQARKNFIQRKIDENQRLITFTIRKVLTVPLHFYVFWSPIERYEYPVLINVKPIHPKDSGHKIYFNLMGTQDKHSSKVVSYQNKVGLGDYNLAKSLTKYQIGYHRYFETSNPSQRVNHMKEIAHQAKEKIKNKGSKGYNKKSTLELQQIQEMDQQSLQLLATSVRKSYHYGNYVYTIYKQVYGPLMTLFFPVFLLGFLNLGIFFQDLHQQGKRVLNVATIIVSYIAFIPTIRRHLPPNDKLVISQVIIFSMASLTILCLFHTISIRSARYWRLDWTTDSLFLVTLSISIFLIIITFSIALGYLFLITPYLREPAEKEKNKIKEKNKFSNEQKYKDENSEQNYDTSKMKYSNKQQISKFQQQDLGKNAQEKNFKRYEWSNLLCDNQLNDGNYENEQNRIKTLNNLIYNKQLKK